MQLTWSSYLPDMGADSVHQYSVTHTGFETHSGCGRSARMSFTVPNRKFTKHTERVSAQEQLNDVSEIRHRPLALSKRSETIRRVDISLFPGQGMLWRVNDRQLCLEKVTVRPLCRLVDSWDKFHAVLN